MRGTSPRPALGLGSQLRGASPQAQAQSRAKSPRWDPRDEEIRKEIRELRGIEQRLHWEVRRRQKKEEHVQEVKTTAEILEEAKRHSIEVKTIEAEKVRSALVVALAASMHKLEHKKEVKKDIKEENMRHISETYRKAMEQARAQQELRRTVAELDREQAVERHEHQMHLAKERSEQRLRHRAEEDADRLHQLSLERAHATQELAKERDVFLHRVELARSAHGGAPKPIPVTSRALTRSLSPQPGRRSTLR